MSAETPAKQELGFRTIVVYKLVKGTVMLLAACALAALLLLGEADHIADEALVVRHHLTAAWSLKLIDAFVSAASRKHLEVLLGALTLDGGFTLFEWYALHTGRPWGTWLVVVATSSLIPFELIAIARHGSPGRIVLLLTNLLIVAYLARRTFKKHGSPFAPAGANGAHGAQGAKPGA